MICKIRLLQSIGYTLSEINDTKECEIFNFEYSIGEKIKQLEQKSWDWMPHKLCKIYQICWVYPPYTKWSGSMCFSDFFEFSLNEFNLDSELLIKH